MNLLDAIIIIIIIASAFVMISSWTVSSRNWRFNFGCIIAKRLKDGFCMKFASFVTKYRWRALSWFRAIVDWNLDWKKSNSHQPESVQTRSFVPEGGDVRSLCWCLKSRVVSVYRFYVRVFMGDQQGGWVSERTSQWVAVAACYGTLAPSDPFDCFESKPKQEKRNK